MTVGHTRSGDTTGLDPWSFTMQNFSIVGLDRDVAEQAVYLREEYEMNMPDAIIYASARTNHANLLTRNAERYDSDWLDVYTPYEL